MIPSTDYVREFLPAPEQDALDASDAIGEPLYMVPIDKLVIDPQFNVRVRNRSWKQHLAETEQSIAQHGFWKHMPLPAYAGKLDDEDVLFVVGGFTRFEAAQNVGTITHLPVVLREPGINTGDLMLSLDADNQSRPLSPYERAVLCKRLRTLGWSERKIAKGLGIAQSYVHQLLGLLDMPEDLQKLVIDERVAATHVINTVARVGPAQALALITADLVLHEGTLAGSPNGERRTIVNRATRLTSRVCLAAIDLAIEQDDLGVLAAWRKGDPDTIATVNSRLKGKQDAQPAGAEAQ